LHSVIALDQGVPAPAAWLAPSQKKLSATSPRGIVPHYGVAQQGVVGCRSRPFPLTEREAYKRRLLSRDGKEELDKKAQSHTYVVKDD
jgi:hypothetical protein